MKEIYSANKSAKIGNQCICPSCGTSFKKQNYQQAFCKSKPKTECKDKYWNTVTPDKKNNHYRISAARSRFEDNQYDPDNLIDQAPGLGHSHLDDNL